MRRPRTRRTIVLLLPALALAACGGGGGGGEGDRSAGQILDDGLAALRTLHSYRVRVTGSTGTSGTATIQLEVASKDVAQGSLSGGGLSAEFRQVGGKLYVHGSQLFRRLLGPDAATRIGDHWVVLPTSAASVVGLDRFLDPAKLAGCIAGQHGTLSKGGTTSVGGRDAVIVVDAGDKPGSTPGRLAVATDAPHYPLRIEQTGPTKAGGSATACGGQGSGISDLTSATATLDSFNAAFSVAAPSGAIDLSAIPGA